MVQKWEQPQSAQALGSLLVTGIQGDYQNAPCRAGLVSLSRRCRLAWPLGAIPWEIFSNPLFRLSEAVAGANIDASLTHMSESTGYLLRRAQVVGLPLAALSRLIVAELAKHSQG